MIYNRYSGAQNERIEKDFKKVKQHISNLKNVFIEMKADDTRNFDYTKYVSIEIKQLFRCSYSSKSSQLYKTCYFY